MKPVQYFGLIMIIVGLSLIYQVLSSYFWLDPINLMVALSLVLAGVIHFVTINGKAPRFIPFLGTALMMSSMGVFLRGYLLNENALTALFLFVFGIIYEVAAIESKK